MRHFVAGGSLFVDFEDAAQHVEGTKAMRLSKRHIVASFVVAMVLALAVVYGCTPRQANLAENALAEETTPIAIEWSLDSDCSVCHTTQDATMEDATTTAGMHAVAADAQSTCISCHTDETSMANVHKGVEAEPNIEAFLKRTEVPSENCTASGCHDTDETSRIEATASLTTFTDSKGTVVNSHAVPTGEGHKDLACSSCHKGHGETRGVDYCYGCHHQRVFECNTCHT
jgi:hypothetical protein